jgi:hypothetical protein
MRKLPSCQGFGLCSERRGRGKGSERAVSHRQNIGDEARPAMLEGLYCRKRSRAQARVSVAIQRSASIICRLNFGAAAKQFQAIARDEFYD